MNIAKLRNQRSEQLKKLRLSAKLTQQQLAQKSGLTRTTISKIERGDDGWSVDSELVYIEALTQHLSYPKLG